MTNKYYYNGELVRTSKTHEYAYGAINFETGKIFGCSGTREGAQKMVNEPINRKLSEIENYERALKALKLGQRGYFCKDGRRTFYIRFSEVQTPTKEKYERLISNTRDYIVWARENLGVVELEKR